MQHTTKYNFNLIETSDAFGPEALNANAEATERELLAVRGEMSAGDAALAATHAADKAALENTAAANKAELQAALATDKKELQTAIQKAQTAANTAQTAADRAQATADVLPFVVGSYRGHGSAGDADVELGFRPSLVIIDSCGESSSGSNRASAYLGSYFGVFTAKSDCSLITFTDTGFTVKYDSSLHPRLNHSRTYDYIAFR